MENDMITIYLSGYMTVHKDDMALAKYTPKVDYGIDPTSITKKEMVSAINKGDLSVLVTSIMERSKWDELALDVTEVE